MLECTEAIGIKTIQYCLEVLHLSPEASDVIAVNRAADIGVNGTWIQ